MSQTCKFLQLSSTFCETYVPQSTLESLQTQKIENPLKVPATGLDLGFNDTQVLDWTPTTDGTVSLLVFRAPIQGSLIGSLSNNIAYNITNSGTYTWRPRLSVPSGEIIPSTKCNNRRGRSFTISIVPDHHVGEANYWPEFAITGLEGKKLSQNCLNIVSGVSTAVPAIIAGGGDNSLRKHSLVAINPPNTAPPASSPTSAAQDSPDNHGSDLSSGAKAAIALGVIVFLLVAAIFGFIWWRLRPKRKGLPTETGDTSAGHQQLPFHGTEDIDTSYQYLPLHETVDTSASHHQPPRSLTVDTYSPTSVEMRPVSTIDPVSPVSPVSTYGPPPPYRYVTKYGTKASPNRDVKPKARRNDGVIVASPEPKHAPATDVPQINDQGQALVGMV